MYTSLDELHNNKIVLQYPTMPVAQVQTPQLDTPKEIAARVKRARSERQKK